MDGNKTVTASFSQDTYTLTVNIVGSGSVSLDPAGGSYLSGTVVELTANATSGWAFGGWSGNVSTVENVTLASTIITMNDDYTITANFAQPILTMVVSGSGNVTPAVGSHVYDSGSTVNVTATPSAGWRFVSWTGDVSTVENVTLASTTITMDEDYTITANFVSIEQNGGGGGGGGGSGGDITHLNEYTTSTGKFVSDATACSADGLVEIEIPKDTVGKDRNGNRLRYISIKKQKTPSDPPADCEFVCLTYNIGPSGATLGPFGYLVFHYNDSEVPEGVAEENLILATWQDGAWVGLEGCIVNPDENTITAPVSHFSFFTAMAHMAPASFEVSGMTVTPDEIQPHESVTVSLTLTNTGDLTGSYTVILEINGAAVQDKVVTLKGSENRVVSFTVTQETDGEYTVSVGSLTDSFTVKEAEGEVVDISEVGTPEPTPAPTPTSRPVETLAKPTQPAVEPAPTAQSPVEPTTSRGIAWWLIVIYAVAGVIIVGLGFYFFVRWRSTAV